MSFPRSRLALLPALMLLVTACGSGNAATASPTAPASAAPAISSAAPSADPFTATWDGLVAAAKAEGEVDVLSGPEGVQQDGPWFDQFTKQYGIKVVITGGATGDITARVTAELVQGVYSFDVASLGGTGTANFSKAGFFDKFDELLINPEVTDRSTGFVVNRPVYTTTGTVGTCQEAAVQASPNLVAMFYNTDKVKQPEIDSVNSWADLLKPEWKGRIVIGDVASGEAGTDSAMLWQALGQSWFDGFFANSPAVVAYGNEREFADALINGKYAIALLPPGTASLIAAEKAGLPVKAWTKTMAEAAVGGSQHMCVMKNRPHPNAAQLLVNWAFMKDGQAAFNAFTNRTDRASTRTDVPQGKIADDLWARAHNPKNPFIEISAAKSDEARAYFKAEFLKLNIIPGG